MSNKDWFILFCIIVMAELISFWLEIYLRIWWLHYQGV